MIRNPWRKSQGENVAVGQPLLRVCEREPADTRADEERMRDGERGGRNRTAMWGKQK